MQKLAKRAIPLALLVLLSGCSKTLVAIASCEIGNRVTVSKDDRLTERTAQDIDANNKGREAAGCDQHVKS